ncbi:ROK family protein [Candidatus Pacearchaeota archaeon]|nr:ROK family protein [Candidatus Pacearchaeota archaeon]
MMRILSLDIGGTNIRGAVVNGAKVSGYLKTPTPKKQKETIAKIYEIVASYGKFDVLCVSTAGFERNGKIVNSLNNDMDGTPLSKLLRQKFKKKVFLGNDANCATLAELHYGVGRGKRNFVLLTLGSGIGGGAVLDGKLYLGNGGALEVGSMRIQDEEIYEHLASGKASVRIAHEMGMKGITSLELEHRADKGDKKAKEVYDKIGRYLGIGMANLAYLFDPEVIIIGGGFSRVKYIYPAMEKTLKELYYLEPKPKIVKAKFGDDAGLIGAALLMKIK